MFYMFIKMSSGWYCQKISGISTADTHAHIANGDMVVFMDDIEDFCDTMDVKMEDITIA